MDEATYQLVRPFLGFAYNEVLRNAGWEERYTINDVPGSTGLDPTSGLFDLFHHSVDGPSVVMPQRGVTDLDVYEAFRQYTRLATIEYALIATTKDADSNEIEAMAVGRGDEHSVKLPAIGLTMIEHRLARGDRFGARFLHNHPDSFVHSLFQLAQIGPSSTDRVAVLHQLRRSLEADRRVVPEFVLIEGDGFIRFHLPPWEAVVATLGRVWRMWQQTRG